MTYIYDNNVKIINYFNVPLKYKSNVKCIDLSKCDKLEKINDYAFRDCCNLKTVILPKNNNNYEISEYSFVGCDRIKFV